MTTQLEIFVERKTFDKWINADCFIQEEEAHQDIFDVSCENGMKRIPIYQYRNNVLFSILGGVENIYNTKLISEPKGLPSDVSDYTKNQSNNFDESYGHSYLTLTDLKEYHQKQIADLSSVDFDMNTKTMKRRSESYDFTLQPIIDEIERIVNKIYQPPIYAPNDSFRIVFWFHKNKI